MSRPVISCDLLLYQTGRKTSNVRTAEAARPFVEGRRYTRLGSSAGEKSAGGWPFKASTAAAEALDEQTIKSLTECTAMVGEFSH
eukprot:scaffold294145_cov35-Prasinocladus_malaysianus.AAC.1